MAPTTFDSLVRTLARARSRRRLLRALAGGLGAGALGREPARAQVCIALPCRTDPGRCAAGGSNCVCCRLPGGPTQCLDRRVCRGSFGTVVEPTPECSGGHAPCEASVACCSGRCLIPPFGCCPVCPEDCACATVVTGGVTCITGETGGSEEECSASDPSCPAGEACVGDGIRRTTCEPLG